MHHIVMRHVHPIQSLEGRLDHPVGRSGKLAQANEIIPRIINAPVDNRVHPVIEVGFPFAEACCIFARIISEVLSRNFPFICCFQLLYWMLSY